MELDFQIDTSWCPGCNRQILPKRHLVSVPPPQPSPTTQQPSTSPRRSDSIVRPTRRSSGRTKGGLVHGTGRAKPNGTIRRSDSSQSKKTRQSSSEQIAPPSPTIPVPPVKQRTVIDQGPTPLYCSDECRLADLNVAFGALSLDYHPDRQSPPVPPVPHNSLSSIAISNSQGSESDSSSSTDSSVSDQPTITSLCHAALAPIYGLPPLPPPPPLIPRTSSSDDLPTNNFQSGVMMAAQRIKAALCPEPLPKRSAFVRPNHQSPPEKKPIPGWTDGSDAWRASVYSFSAPRDSSVAGTSDDNYRRAYKSFVASPHKSSGVYSTLDAAYQTPTVPVAAPPLVRNKTVDELYSKYSLALSRRCDSRSSLSSFSPALSQARSLPSAVGQLPRKKEVSILKPGAEGKLLVPNVKLRVSTSYVSVSASSSVTTESYRSSRLVRRGSEYSEDGMASVSEQTEEEEIYVNPSTQTRSWSYDNLVTYPVMQLPPKKERRVEKQIVDGVEKEVEVEVEIPSPPLKRLFLFPGKEVR